MTTVSVLNTALTASTATTALADLDINWCRQTTAAHVRETQALNRPKSSYVIGLDLVYID